jgi:phosphatidylglycerol lysyltransferase
MEAMVDDQPDGLAELGGGFAKFAFLVLVLTTLHNAVFLEFTAILLAASGIWNMRSDLLAGKKAMTMPSRRARRGMAPSYQDLLQARAVVDAGRAAEAHLVCLGDKQLLWSDCGRGFMMYARQGRSLIALFDPAGPQALWPDLMRRFLALATAQGCKPVMYQASERFAKLACDGPMRAFKLGELAQIDLRSFEMAGKDWASLRRAINRAERDGLDFSVLAPKEVDAVLPELAMVSEAWLGMNKAGEKGFSLGAFTPAYVSAFPLGIIRYEGRIVAFVNIVTAGSDAFIDLMRFVPGVHRGVMDLLIVRVIEMLKAQGYERLNLGMAPLAGLDGDKVTAWARIGHLVFERGNHFYNFKGLLAFKAKFKPDWKPRYLLVEQGASPFLAATSAALLIAGGPARMLRR